MESVPGLHVRLQAKHRTRGTTRHTLFSVLVLSSIIMIIFIRVHFNTNTTHFNRYKDRLNAKTTKLILKEEITIVTAYFNIGRFQKGESGNYYTTEHYKLWMKIFSCIENPVIAFFDDNKYANLFQTLRSHLPKNITKIVHISRDNLWAFQMKPRIEEIFNTPGYPKHNPNTVIPDYSCIMHAKYELMANVSNENPFNTKYIAWLDIGLFRDIAGNADRHIPFKLTIPPKFNESQVAYSKVAPVTVDDIRTIFLDNMVFVCGCFFIGNIHVMSKWTEQYIYYSEKYIMRNLANTDQQVLYAMLIDSEKPNISIQTYYPTGKYNKWFHLGYLCKEQWEENKHNQLRVQRNELQINGNK